MARFLVFDTETTGLPYHPSAKLSAQPRIIEFAAVVVDEEGRRLDETVVLLDPAEKLEAVITKITGLTDADLRGKPSFADAFPALREFFEECDFMIAHNLPFDRKMVALELERAGLELRWPAGICTVQENAERWGRRPRLLELYEEVVGEPLDQTHRALDDVEALVEVCQQTGVLRDAIAAA